MYKESDLWCAKVGVLIVMSAIVSGCAHTTLEQQFEGFEACRIKDVFLDPVTHKVSGSYFAERKLEPCRVDEAAFYCVKDTFYGLTVSQVAIPYRGPFSVHAVYLEESPAAVEVALRAQFKGVDFNREDGTSPFLIANPDNKKGSVLYCDEHSE